MKSKTSLRTLFIVLLCILCAASLIVLASCQGNNVEPVDKEEAIPSVRSVTLKLDNTSINGTLSVDLSLATVSVTAEVVKDEGVEADVAYSSSNEEVATIDGDGKIMLLKKGESVITATAGDKQDKFVLIIGVSLVNRYTVTVIGGSADRSQAIEGEQVCLSPSTIEHKTFVGWSYSVEGVWVNGNVFEMPSSNVTVTANFEDMLYTLNVVGGKMVNEDGEVVEGEYGGNTKDGDDIVYDTTVYKLPYGSVVDLVPVTQSDMMFVAWDIGSRNVRSFGLGTREIEITMPDQTMTVWAVASKSDDKFITVEEVSGITSELTTLEGRKAFHITGDNALPLPITTENLQGSVFTTADYAKAVEIVIKNDGAEEIAMQFYPSYHGNSASSGEIVVPAGETVRHTYAVTSIVSNCYWGAIFTREALNYDITFSLCATSLYPDGDPYSLANVEYVQLYGEKSSTNGRVSGGTGTVLYTGNNFDDGQYKIWYVNSSVWTTENAPHFTNNDTGTTVIATRGSWMTQNFTTYGRIKNISEFDASQPIDTIYARLMNCSYRTPNANYRIFVANKITNFADENQVKQNIIASADIKFTLVNQEVVVKLDFLRSLDEGEYAIGIMTNDTTFGYYNMCLQLAYNNVFGYKECEHVCEDLTEILAATCSDSGYSSGYCSVCCSTIIVDAGLDQEAHVWDSSEGKITEQICAEGGNIMFTCVGCGATKEELVTAGHQYSAYVLDTEPEGDNVGVCTKACQRCGKVSDEKIDVRSLVLVGCEIEDETKYVLAVAQDDVNGVSSMKYYIGVNSDQGILVTPLEITGKMFVGFTKGDEKTYFNEVHERSFVIDGLDGNETYIAHFTNINNSPIAVGTGNLVEGVSTILLSVDPTTSTEWRAIKSGSFDTIVDGSLLFKLVVRNNGNVALALEVSPEAYGCRSSSGRLDVAAGQTVVHYYVLPVSFANANWQYKLCENVVQSLSFNIGAVCAPYYEDYDADYIIENAQYAQFGLLLNKDYFVNKTTWNGRDTAYDNQMKNNNYGIWAVASSTINLGGYKVAKLTNLPEFDEHNTTTTVYIKVRNLVAVTGNGKVSFGIYTTPSGSSVGTLVGEAKVVTLAESGQEAIVELRFTREAGVEYYLGMVKTEANAGCSFGFNIQVTYNDVFAKID